MGPLWVNIKKFNLCEIILYDYITLIKIFQGYYIEVDQEQILSFLLRQNEDLYQDQILHFDLRYSSWINIHLPIEIQGAKSEYI